MFESSSDVLLYIMYIALFGPLNKDVSTNEPQRDKTDLLAYAYSEDSSQPAYVRSIIRVFDVRKKKHCILDYSKYGHWIFWSITKTCLFKYTENFTTKKWIF